ASRIPPEDRRAALMAALEYGRSQRPLDEARVVADVAPLLPEALRSAVVSSAAARLGRAEPTLDLLGTVARLAPHLDSDETDALATHLIAQLRAAGLRAASPLIFQIDFAIQLAVLAPHIGHHLLEDVLAEIAACVEATRGYATRARLLR